MKQNKCDGCGAMVSEKLNKVYDENYNLQKGLGYCNECSFGKKADHFFNIDYTDQLEKTIHELIAYGREKEEIEKGSGVKMLYEITQNGTMRIAMMLEIKQAIENPDLPYELKK